MSTVRDNIKIIRGNIADAAYRSGRKASDIRLMAVTKTVTDERIIEAIDAGVDIIGENYVQEAKRKIEKLGKNVEWHMIGHLQSKKSRYAVRLFDMIHSIDRIKLARKLDKRSKMAECITKILIEINISGEETKSGVKKEDVLNLVRDISVLENLSIQGLMTMPPWFDDPEDARPYFVTLRKLRDKIAGEKIPNVEMSELSMGMSGDYKVAVEEGATIVRIGTSIFGERL